MLQNELNNDVVHFTTYIKPVLQQIKLLTGLNVDGKTRNITLQLVLQQCCMASCMFFEIEGDNRLWTSGTSPITRLFHIKVVFLLKGLSTLVKTLFI